MRLHFLLINLSGLALIMLVLWWFFFGKRRAEIMVADQPIKILVKALKDATIGKVKSGFLGRDDLPAGRQALDEAKIIQLSSLPTKDELRGQTVGVLVAPLRGIISVLQGNLRNLVYALSEIQKVKGGV